MELSKIIQYLALVVCVCSVIASEDNNSRWLRKSLKSARRSRDSAKRNSKDADEDVITDKDSNCCQNGGICIMGSFCHCKKQFYGRYCQHRQRHRSCGTIKHGTWMMAGCTLCHCFDGRLECKDSEIPGCELMSYTEAREIEPDYNVDVDKKSEDYDKFYDDEPHTSSQMSSGTSPTMTTLSMWLVCVWMVIQTCLR